MVFNMNLKGIKPVVFSISEHKYRIINTENIGLVHNFNTNRQSPTGRVLNSWSGPVLEKIPSSGSGSGRVGVSKYIIRYLFYYPVFPGILGVFRVFLGISWYIVYHLFFGGS